MDEVAQGLPWAQALLFYGVLPFLGFVGGFLFSQWWRGRVRRARNMLDHGSKYL